MANLILVRIQGKENQKTHFPNVNMNKEKVLCYIMTY